MANGSEDYTQAQINAAINYFNSGMYVPGENELYDNLVGTARELNLLPAIPTGSINPVEAVVNAAVGSSGAIPEVTQTLGGAVRPYVPQTIVDIAGIGEAGLSMGSGLLSLPVAGAAGIWQFAGEVNEEGWYEALGNATDSMLGIMGSMTYQPRTQPGKDVTAVITAPFLAYDQFTLGVGRRLTDLLGGPVAGEGSEEFQQKQIEFKLSAEQVIDLQDRGEPVPPELMSQTNTLREELAELVPDGLPNARVNNAGIFAGVTLKALLDFFPDLVSKGSAMRARSRKIDNFRAKAKEAGIDLQGRTDAQLLTWSDAAEKLTGGQEFTAQQLATLQNDIQMTERHVNQVGHQLYDAAKNAGEEAYYPQLQLKLLDGSVADSLAAKHFDLSEMPLARKWVERLKNINEKTAFDVLDSDAFDFAVPGTGTPGVRFGYDAGRKIEGYVKINELHNYRRRLNGEIRRLTRSNDSALATEGAAMNDILTQVNGFIENQFLADAIVGTPEVIGKWKKANSWWRYYKDNFSAPKVIDKMVEGKFTAKTAEQQILGLGKTNMKGEAATVVNHLKNIFGSDSPQIRALQAEVIFKTAWNLMEEGPGGAGTVNTQGFQKAWRDMKRENHEVLNSLLTPRQMDNLNFLDDAISAQEKALGRRLTARELLSTREGLPIRRWLAVNIAPGQTGLAKGAASIGIVTGALQGTWNVLKAGFNRRGIEREIMTQFYGQDMNLPLRQIQNIPVISGVYASRVGTEEGQTLEGLRDISGRLREATEELRQ